jgi:pantoate--beta-alanine ligase
MHLVHKITDLRNILEAHRIAKESIGFVPTMGNLHEGHSHLIQNAVKENDRTVVSIFINPLQFSPSEDFESYPRSLEEDEERLRSSDCDYLFAPPRHEMLQGTLEEQSKIRVPRIAEILCGKSRPGHFEGVASIVSQLLNIVNPTRAYFGLKDYQQFILIKKLVADLKIPVTVKGVETVRNKNGLALSSRNSFFSAQEIDIAPQLFASIKEIYTALQAGNRNFKMLENNARKRLLNIGFQPDYCSVCQAETLKPAAPDDKDMVILVAAHLGSVRLIDNLRLSLS